MMNISLYDNQLIVSNILNQAQMAQMGKAFGDLVSSDVIKVGNYRLENIKKVYFLPSAGFSFVYENKTYRVITIDDVILKEDKR